MPCGAGAICDLTDPAGPTCISATGDLDGDGIPNGKDFCEHAAGGAHDEDNDGIGDECDPCPIAKPPATPDRDGDAVDSPCDPDPDTAGDKILLFDGFNDPLGSNYVPTTPGAWAVQGGELVVTNIASRSTCARTSPRSRTWRSRPRIASTSSRPARPRIWSPCNAHDPRPAGVASFECGVVHADSGTGDVVDLETNQNTSSTRALGSAFNSASLYRPLRMRAAATSAAR